MATNNKQESAPKPMSEAQVAFIRSLFKEVRDLLDGETQTFVIEAMKAHISGVEVKDTKWASGLIDELKAARTKANIAKARAIRAAQVQKKSVEEEINDLFFPEDNA
jgi:hypothetical protein